jgi:dihydrodipicolinate synthase/N-acetylneuraminate lyase
MKLTNTISTQKRYPRTILGTACIPWNGDYTFDESSFRKLVKRLIENGLTHIYIFGTAGEGYAVTNNQFKEIVKVFAEEMKEFGLFPMVGIISLSQQIMIERIEIAYSYGIRDFMFALPAWGALNDEELRSFINRICTPYPDCRFVHYNNTRSKKIITIKEYESLAVEIPNLVGAKYSTSNMTDLLSLMRSSCPMQFFITEMGFGYASMFGECGLLVSIASIHMTKAWEYFNAAVSRDYDKVVNL